MLQSIYEIVNIQTLAWYIILLPLIGVIINTLIAIMTAEKEIGSFKPVVSFVGVFFPFLSFVSVLIIFLTLIDFEGSDPAFVTGSIFSWMSNSALNIEIGLKVDQLSIIMALMVTGVGTLIHLYSVGYMQRDAGFARYFAKINLFLFFMLILVLADNLILMFVGWEGVGLCSYLLIGYWFEDEKKAKAGTKAFIVNRIGDACFLAGLFLIYAVMQAANAPTSGGYFNFALLSKYNAYFVPTATIISLLLFAGAAAKSAQIPLYVWLPDAMAGPTPVSALIHAATMVTAGVYMIARLNFIFALSPTALNIIGTIGALTALYAAIIAVTQNNLKKILAYSTISQLGFMFMALGAGAFSAAIFHLLMHSFFKALLFLCAGSVIHALAGEEDIRKMGGLRFRMPLTTWTFVIAAFALAGIAPLSGFFSKDAILWQIFERGNYFLWMIGFVATGLTAFYIFRVAGMVFFGETNIPVDKFKKAHEGSASMIIPLMLLAFLSFVGGFIGIPEIFGGTNLLWEWLSSLVAYEISTSYDEAIFAKEIVVLVITLLWSIHFTVLSWVIYSQRREWSENMAVKFGFFYKFISNKFYIDELYDLLIVKPVKWISEKILWKGIDNMYIDGLIVHGFARSIGFFSSVISLMQTGKLQHYLLYFLIGAAILIGFFAL